MHCNAGTSTTNMVGDLAGYGTVWYHRLGIANILSLAKVKGEYDIRFDSGARNCFEVEKKDRSGRKMVFNQSQNGFYSRNTGTSCLTVYLNIQRIIKIPGVC